MTDSQERPTLIRHKKSVEPLPEAKKAQPAQPKRRGRPPKATKGSKEASVNIGVKVNQALWRRLRALALRRGENTGVLLDQAVKEYLDKHEKG